ncbi:nucleotidyltransferase family protein [Thalassospira sp. NFXS8]|uniref:nucleotidyltransferase family protein n=1 Tax=Thalassospira sp. NFXS8 TaxID=2819093 RepID=UPI0032DE67C5
MKLAGLILAAGESKRFGGRKQLAKLNGKPMLQHTVDHLEPLFGKDLFVVLGAFHDEIRPHIKHPVNIVINPDWPAGMGTSIAAGIGEICRYGAYDGILIALADQMKIGTAQYLSLINQFEKNRIVASRYGNKNAVPAIFPASLFTQLASLNTQTGARELLVQQQQNTISVPIDDASFDVDFKSDLAALQNDKILN